MTRIATIALFGTAIILAASVPALAGQGHGHGTSGHNGVAIHDPGTGLTDSDLGAGRPDDSGNGASIHDPGTGLTDPNAGGWGPSPENGWVRHYAPMDVDLSEDVFVNRRRFADVTGGMRFVDDDGDGIADIVQDTDQYAALGLGEFVDDNEDGICDLFQSREMYEALGMNSFVDADGDGICDNYVDRPDFSHRRHYGAFAVDLSEDVFVNRQRLSEVTGGMGFVDDNGDGICDVAQDTELFASLGFGEFVDENGDTIHDAFQTRGMYRMLGMGNFVDTDGDGLCDNYEPPAGDPDI